MSNIEKDKNESYDNYSLRMIIDRSSNELEYDELFDMLTDVQYSNDNARKALSGVKAYLLKKESMSDESTKDAKLRYKESIEINKDGVQISDKLIVMSEEQRKDPDYMLEAHGYDKNKFELLNVRNNFWNVYSKQDGVQTLYSSKITVKPILQEFNEDWICDVIDGIDFSNVKISNSKDNNNIDGYVVEVNFADVHLGKYVSELVSKENYNLDIAKEAYLGMIDEAIDRMSNMKVKQIVFIFGQDYINVDNKVGTTTRGTRQDMDRFFEEVYKTGLEVLIKSVEKLRKIANVEAIYIKGNHDSQSTYTMAVAMEKMYE
jgi:hypothetical protein